MPPCQRLPSLHHTFSISSVSPTTNFSPNMHTSSPKSTCGRADVVEHLLVVVTEHPFIAVQGCPVLSSQLCRDRPDGPHSLLQQYACMGSLQAQSVLKRCCQRPTVEAEHEGSRRVAVHASMLQPKQFCWCSPSSPGNTVRCRS